MRYQLDKQTIRWVENCPDSWTQRVVISCMNSSWQPASTGSPRDQYWHQYHLTLLLMACTTRQSTLSAPWQMIPKGLGAVSNTPEDKAVQSDCNRLEKPTHKTLAQLNTSMCIVLYLGQNNPIQHYMANWLKSCFAENCLGVLVNKELNTN